MSVEFALCIFYGFFFCHPMDRPAGSPGYYFWEALLLKLIMVSQKRGYNFSVEGGEAGLGLYLTTIRVYSGRVHCDLEGFTIIFSRNSKNKLNYVCFDVLHCAHFVKQYR